MDRQKKIVRTTSKVTTLQEKMQDYYLICDDRIKTSDDNNTNKYSVTDGSTLYF